MIIPQRVEGSPPTELTGDEQLHWLALRLTPGLGNRKAGQLIDVYRTPQAIFRASKSELQAAGLTAAVAQSVISGCAFEDAADQQQKTARAGAAIIPLISPRYPTLLRRCMMRPRFFLRWGTWIC